MLAAAIVLALGVGRATADEPLHLPIVGGLGGINQYVRLEEPFWRQIEGLTDGHVQATIHPMDQSGLRGQEMLQLMRLGVVPFGTAILSIVAGDEPELNAVDLPVANPDIAALHVAVERYRGRLRQILRDRYEIELLGVYVYPAQVLFCAKAFEGLQDLAGRRVRTSSVGQSEMMSALGAVPVQLPFAEMMDAAKHGAVECAITGTSSGNRIGLSDTMTHLYPMPIGWGVSVFGANVSAWAALPPDIRSKLAAGISDLESRIWAAAEEETVDGLACDTGVPTCHSGHLSHMTLVPISPDDSARRVGLMADSILPRWIERCGRDCVDSWNGLLAGVTGVEAKSE